MTTSRRRNRRGGVGMCEGGGSDCGIGICKGSGVSNSKNRQAVESAKFMDLRRRPSQQWQPAVIVLLYTITVAAAAAAAAATAAATAATDYIACKSAALVTINVTVTTTAANDSVDTSCTHAMWSSLFIIDVVGSWRYRTVPYCTVRPYCTLLYCTTVLYEYCTGCELCDILYLTVLPIT